ncbi:MAG: Ig-like domain repeat protein [Terriglobia bacterium]
MKISQSMMVSAVVFSASLILFPLVSPAQTNVVRGRVTEAVDMQNLVTLRGNVHPLARPQFDQGVAPDDLPMQRMLLVLQRGMDQETALRKLLDDQQVKSSAQFHQWLTPEQFGRQFGPADSDLHAVTDWLASQGFQVTNVAAGRTVIEFSGTAGLVRQVLGTEIHKFRVNGADHWANTSDPQIPAALAPVVAGFASLNNFPRIPTSHSLGTFRRTKATGKVEPMFTFPVTCSDGSSGCVAFVVGPGDFATIYNLGSLWTAGTAGAGQTIAVVGETNINPIDVSDFRNMFGLPANQPNIILNGPDPGILSNGEETESDLDVEWSGAVAEDATIDFVVSETTETTAGIDLSALYIIDNNLAPVMSESYSGCETTLGAGGNQFYNTLWEQAAAQGITVLLSTGDSGSAGCDSSQLNNEVAAAHGLAVSGFASTPFNVAVGGTDLSFNQNNYTTYWSMTNSSPWQASAKSYIPEITWNDSCAASGSLTGCTPPPNSTYLAEGAYLAAGGGGSSVVYPKPSWQYGTGVPSDGARDLPDVSLLADGYVICETDANYSSGGSATSCDLNSPYTDFQVVGGTSASVQAFAGIMAMVNQAHGRQGNANYVLYPMTTPNGATCNSSTAPATSSSCIFYDVTQGNNSVICQGGTPNCSNANPSEYGVLVYGSPGSIAYPSATGYDLATGLGSVNVANLVKNWKSNFTTSTTTLSLSTNPATNPITLTHGQPINFTVSVAPGSGSGTPAGDVSLIPQNNSQSTISTTGIGPFTLSGGSVSGSTLMLPGGSYNVTAHYAGNGTYAASDSSPVAVKVSTEVSKTIISLVTPGPTYTTGASTLPYGAPFILRMDVTNGGGQSCAPVNSSTGEQQTLSYPCPTGTVTVNPPPIEEGGPTGAVPGVYPLNSQGYAEDQFPLPPGTYSFAASYGGDSSYTSSTSNSLPLTINPGATTTTLGTLPTSVVAGTTVSLTASFATAASYGLPPNGNIQFFSNGNSLGSSALLNLSQNTTTYAYSAQASLSTPLPAGADSITAKFVGDTNYAPSTSSAASIAVGDFSVSANPSPLVISAPGQPGASTISVSPQNGFTGTVNLSVASGCPTGASCTFASPAVTVSGASAVTDVLTITTTGSASAPPALQRGVPPNFRFPAGFLGLLAGMLVLATLLGSATMRRSPATLLFATMLTVAGVWVACGGSGGGGGSPTPTPTPAVSLSSSSLTFTSQNMGTTSSAQSVTLTNSGTATLSITNTTLTGTNSGDFAQTNTCGSSVAAAANCSISVTFTPTAAGARSASVSITDNASGSPHTITLSGTGTSQSTPAGTYPIVVNGVSGSDSHSITVNVTVQ